ncbi:hypothetical protein HZB04_02055 [Candidatus Wolfebacteria bacterium]|nr:hypothetical protein [Candidatus Wolfebacteria bacterium]
MKKNYLKIVVGAVIISLVGVYVIDYFSHLLFSSPMETTPYFLAKLTLYFVFSILFLSFINVSKKEFIKVAIAGIVVSSLWGMYYNIFPLIFDYYPFGISLGGLTFLGMGLFGTGFAFGIVHTLAFILGYYSSKLPQASFNDSKIL